MSYLRKFLIPAALLWTLTTTAEVNLGDSLQEVKESIGEPVGTVALREKMLLLYPQGEITIKNDVVIHFDLMSDEEFAADQIRLQTEREQWQKEQKQARIARIAQGKALKADRLQSSSFTAKSAEDRLAFWRRFQVNYPEIDVSIEVARAIESYQVEIQELKNQEMIAELKARVARAETEAEEAKLEAEKLRKEIEETKQRGLRVYTTPIYDQRYYYKPPTIIIHSGRNKN